MVDDASNDGTVQVLQQSIARMVDKIIYHPVNRGKGAALRSGFAAATGDAVVVRMPILNTARRSIRSCSVRSRRAVDLSLVRAFRRPAASRRLFLAHGR